DERSADRGAGDDAAIGQPRERQHAAAGQAVAAAEAADDLAGVVEGLDALRRRDPEARTVGAGREGERGEPRVGAGAAGVGDALPAVIGFVAGQALIERADPEPRAVGDHGRDIARRRAAGPGRVAPGAVRAEPQAVEAAGARSAVRGAD